MSYASGTLLPSAARTATTSTADITSSAETPNAGGVIFYVDYTATPNDAQTVIASIEAKDPTSAKYVTLGNFATQTASSLGATPTTATLLYILHPGITKTLTAANVEISALLLPATFRLMMTHSAAGSWTYTVSYALVD